MENLKAIPFNQPTDGIPVPLARERGNHLEGLVLSMKVGQCVRLEDDKALHRARWYAKKHEIPVVARAVGDGSHVLWRRRKNGKSA